MSECQKYRKDNVDVPNTIIGKMSLFPAGDDEILSLVVQTEHLLDER
jgi:hypothetical protein